ncbi:stress response protein [Lignipirellula cremea]|uniref:Tellurium resistance protein n=1 Tax=Lignipirellula cremea TaxID=2528010 RepID=A0A518E2G5_9BACT|nr:stress response protein [Lignipirellula cremea]QDU98285.1 Tellurium resistance protein [Lignipirellula cremea]
MADLSETWPSPNWPLGPWSFTLRWRGEADLDLMAFYRLEDGASGGVYSERYDGGSQGAVGEAPWMRLSRDAGGQPGEHAETLMLEQVAGLSELLICAVNFTEASLAGGTVFADVDARLEASGEGRVFLRQPLDTTEPGAVAVLVQGAAGEAGWEWSTRPEVLSFPELQTLAPAARRLSLTSKTVLDQPQATAAMSTAAEGEICVHLRWSPRVTTPSFLPFLSRTRPVDIDLGCFFELADGDRAAVQPLNDGFFKNGSFHESPWIYHLGDDRSGSRVHGELLKINAAQWSQIRRVLLFAFLYEGAPRWSESDAVLSIQPPGSPLMEIPLGEQTAAHGFCAAALLENEQGQVRVTRLVTFHDDHPTADQFYGWGLNWGMGEKE